MGLTLARFFYRKQVRILIVGLDGSGKTAILYCLKLGEVVSTIPTMGFNVETVRYKGVNYVLWDAGGEFKIRPLWRHYIQKTHGIIFVVDSADRSRIEEAKEELKKILDPEEVIDAVLLVLANKKDLPNAIDTNELIESLGLRHLGKRKWHILQTSIYQASTLYEPLKWLSKEMLAH